MKGSSDQLSRIDKNILRLLQGDGRISYAELARQVGLTTTPCIERVKRLERDGYIQTYSTVLNPEKLDAGLIVFVQIRLDRTSKDTFAQFKEAVLELPEVQESTSIVVMEAIKETLTIPVR